jgi:hypothetical protein
MIDLDEAEEANDFFTLDLDQEDEEAEFNDRRRFVFTKICPLDFLFDTLLQGGRWCRSQADEVDSPFERRRTPLAFFTSRRILLESRQTSTRYRPSRLANYSTSQFWLRIGSYWRILDLAKDKHILATFQHPPKDDVLPIQELGRLGRNKELARESACGAARAGTNLTAVGVFARIGHGQKTGSRVLDLEVLIGELATVYRHAARSIAIQEVAAYISV